MRPGRSLEGTLVIALISSVALVFAACLSVTVYTGFARAAAEIAAVTAQAQAQR